MAIAALIAWLLTAAGGFVLLGTWVAKGGTKSSHLPTPVIFGHFALAAAGLVIWIIYVATKTTGLAWTGFILLLPVAGLGFVMLARWIPTYRARTPVPAATTGAAAPAAEAATGPAERHFPLPVVAGHGLLAVVTLVLVLITALQAS
jgi:hypothetical protein